MFKDERRIKMIYAIIGPTASSKSNYAVKLAKEINAEIINVDAYSIYKELDIVSAKITKKEMQGVKHHFVSHFDISEKVDIVLFQKLVRAKILQLQNLNKNIILVGGSNLYMQVVLFNYEIEDKIKYDYDKYEQLELTQISDVLKNIDPEYLNKAQNNKRRMIKAILYNEITSLKYSQKINKGNELFYNDVKFYYMNIKRDLLYERINLRVKKMFSEGLEKEFNYLKEKYDINSLAFKAIGFQEFINFANLNEEELIELISQNTRRLAKRQLTWLNNKILNNNKLNITYININK